MKRSAMILLSVWYTGVVRVETDHLQARVVQNREPKERLPQKGVWPN